VLGGSHAGGTADARSDVDFGLYYRPEDPLDLDSLRRLVAEIDDLGRGDAVTDLGEWGRGSTAEPGSKSKASAWT
jgi:hypothetical protein